MPDGTRRRQARGARRIEEILDAAGRVFADIGYEGATTNAIASEAGISPGSLYQFFKNKDAIAEALSQRYLEQMRTAHAKAFDPNDVRGLSVDDLLDRIIDPIVAFNIANPGLKALFANTDMPPQLTEATRTLHGAVSDRAETLIKAYAPTLSTAKRRRWTTVSIQIVRAMMPPIVAASGRERTALVKELKKALRGYIELTLEDR